MASFVQGLSSQSATLNRRLRKAYVTFNRTKYLFLLMLPGIAFYFVFRYIPIYGVTLAWKDFVAADGIIGSPWVGWKYFERLITLPGVRNVFLNTIKISALRIVFGFPAPIILALMLNEVRNAALKRTMQTISYLPHFLSWVVVAGLIRQILSPSVGLLGYIYSIMGQTPPMLLTNPSAFMVILIASGVWQAVGWGTIVYLAAIAGINPELYEAGIIDGAGRFQMIRHITIPSIKGVIVILFILRIGFMMEAGFDQIFNLYNPLVYNVGDIISTYVYRMGIQDFQYSFATAVGLFQNVVGLVALVGANWFVKRLGHAGAYTIT